MEPPNLDFSDFVFEIFILLFMVYKMRLVGQFINYINSEAVKCFR